MTNFLAVSFILFSIVFLFRQPTRNLIFAVLVIAVLEGALRKWVLPGASAFIYFFKDFILAIAYIKFFFLLPIRKPWLRRAVTIMPLFLMAIAICILQVFNPALGSPIVGVFGLRGYLFYIPLAVILPYIFHTEKDLYNFLRTYLLLVIPVGILGIIQFFNPANSPFNIYAPDQQIEIATFGGNARITGTFSYISGYATFLITCFALALPLLTSKQNRLWQFATIVELLLILANSFMTGSRGVIFAQLLFMVGYIGIPFLVHPTKGISVLIKKITIPAVIVSAAAIFWFSTAIDAFTDRVNANDDIPQRVLGSFSEPFYFWQQIDTFSYGIGATHQAVNVLRAKLMLPAGDVIPYYFEGESGRVFLELGLIGFILWYLFRITIIFLLWKTFTRLKRPLLQNLALSAFMVHLIQLTGQLVVNHTFLVYYWFLAGFVFLLPQLEQFENRRQMQQLLTTHAHPSHSPGPSHQ